MRYKLGESYSTVKIMAILSFIRIIRVSYYGLYSNKKRGMLEKKKPKDEQAVGIDEPDKPYRRKCKLKWAALIKAVFEVDPLKCLNCGSTMRIISFIDQDEVIREIL